MAEESLGLTTATNPELTKEEYLERHVWTLQYYFEELLKDDADCAWDFFHWCLKTLLDKEEN